MLVALCMPPMHNLQVGLFTIILLHHEKLTSILNKNCACYINSRFVNNKYVPSLGGGGGRLIISNGGGAFIFFREEEAKGEIVGGRIGTSNIHKIKHNNYL